MASGTEFICWHNTALHVQGLLGVVFTIGLLGYSIRRVLLLGGWITIKNKKKKLARSSPGSKDKTGKHKKKMSQSISRQAIYSSRRYPS